MGFTVAVDTTPLLATPTGIAEFTARLVEGLARVDGGPTVLPYVLSRRVTKVPRGTRRLTIPARAALALWARADWPTERRRLRGADVVHGTNYVAPPTGWPTVLTVHDMSPFLRPSECTPAIRALAPAVRRLVGRGAFVHAPSDAVACQVRDVLGTDRVRTVYHGLPAGAEPVAHPLRPDRPYVLALGTLEPRKNLVRLVRAYGLAQRRLPDLALVLAGADGSAGPEIDREIARLAAGALVVRTGWVDPAGRADLLGHARALAYPSLDEGFGLPMLEAMAEGVPVVASSIPALTEIGRDGALFVDPLDVDGLAEAVLRACQDVAVRETLVRRGKENSARFSWRESARGLIALYREAMAQGLRR